MKPLKILFAALFVLLLSACAQYKQLSSVPSGKFPPVNQDGKIAIVAHRGYWNCEAAGNSQNSIAALAEAQKAKVWGSECDVHMTADGKIVVCHDQIVDGKEMNDYLFDEISGKTLANGERKPSFESYVRQAACGAEGTVLVVEIKCQLKPETETALVKKVIAVLKKYRMYDPSKVVFISFSLRACDLLARLAPEFTNQYLYGDVAPKKLANLGINGIDYMYSVLARHPEWVSEAHSLGMSVNVWTLDREEEMRNAISWGVDAITTNQPLLLRSILGDREYRK